MQSKTALGVAAAISVCIWTGVATAAPEPEPAATPTKVPATTTVMGTVTKVDDARKMFDVRDESGRQLTVRWNGATRFADELREGALVEAKTVTKDGEAFATIVRVRATKYY